MLVMKSGSGTRPVRTQPRAAGLLMPASRAMPLTPTTPAGSRARACRNRPHGWVWRPRGHVVVLGDGCDRLPVPACRNPLLDDVLGGVGAGGDGASAYELVRHAVTSGDLLHPCSVSAGLHPPKRAGIDNLVREEHLAGVVRGSWERTEGRGGPFHDVGADSVSLGDERQGFAVTTAHEPFERRMPLFSHAGHCRADGGRTRLGARHARMVLEDVTPPPHRVFPGLSGTRDGTNRQSSITAPLRPSWP